MSYIKQTWVDGASGGTPVNAARLQHMEDGIDAGDATFRLVPGSAALPTNDLAAFGIYTPEKYGAVGDGSTNDQAALQACVNAAVAAGGTIYFRRTNYRIVGLVSIPLGQRFTFAFNNTTFTQATDNTSIFRFRKENTWGWSFTGNAHFTWTNLQPATNTGAIAISFDTDTNLNNGIYNYRITGELLFTRGFCGIAQATPPATINPAWGGYINCVIGGADLSGPVIDLANGPNLQIEHFYALRNGSILPALRLQNMNSVKLGSFEVNNINGVRQIDLTTVVHFVADVVRFEAGTFTQNFGALIGVSGGSALFRSVLLQAVTFATGGWGALFFVNTNATVEVDLVTAYDVVSTNNSAMVFCSGATDFSYTAYIVQSGSALTAVVYDFDASKTKVKRSGVSTFPNGVTTGNAGAGLAGALAGVTIHGGVGAPASGLGTNGDAYIRTDTPGTANQWLYKKAAGAWVGVL